MTEEEKASGQSANSDENAEKGATNPQLTKEDKKAIEQHVNEMLKEKVRGWWKIAAAVIGLVGGGVFFGARSVGTDYIRATVEKDVGDVHQNLGRIQQAIDDMTRSKQRAINKVEEVENSLSKVEGEAAGLHEACCEDLDLVCDVVPIGVAKDRHPAVVHVERLKVRHVQMADGMCPGTSVHAAKSTRERRYKG